MVCHEEKQTSFLECMLSFGACSFWKGFAYVSCVEGATLEMANETATLCLRKQFRSRSLWHALGHLVDSINDVGAASAYWTITLNEEKRTILWISIYDARDVPGTYFIP